jgi:hypothetical protein
MRVMRTLTTVTDVIDALGGPTKFGKMLGVSAAAITNWARRGRIPPQWAIKLRRDLLQLGLVVDDAVFDEPTPYRSPKVSGSVSL